MGAIERMNWSTLKHLAVSARNMKYRVDHPQEDTPALKLGRALHCLLIEPQNFDDRWVVSSTCSGVVKKSGEICGSTGSLYLSGKWYCKVRGHAPAGAGDLPNGLESITTEERELAKILAARIAEHPAAAETLRGGKAEERLEWIDAESGVACKGRLDWLKPSRVVDLKTTCTETPREFMADAARRGYHGQLAWYHYGAIAAGRIPQDAPLPRIVAVSTVEPYDVAVYEFTPEALEAGRLFFRELLTKYTDCLAAEIWPGHSPDLQPFELPKWAEGMQAVEARGEF